MQNHALDATSRQPRADDMSSFVDRLHTKPGTQ
jgi:hypothetical protein